MLLKKILKGILWILSVLYTLVFILTTVILFFGDALTPPGSPGAETLDEINDFMQKPLKDMPIRVFIIIVGWGLSTYILTNFLKNTNTLDDEKQYYR